MSAGSRFIVSTLAMAAVLLAAPWGVAQPGPTTGCPVEAEAPRPGPWAGEVRHDSDTFEFEASQETGPGVHVAFDVGTAQITWTLSNGTTNRTHVTSTITLASVIEFRDADDDGGFGPGDTAVVTHALAGTAGATVQVVERRGIGADAVVLYPINASGAGGLPVDDPPLPGRLRIVLSVDFTRPLLEAPAGTPDRFPISVQLQDFPFRSNDTLVALDVRHDVGADVLHDEGRITHSSGLLRGAFVWAPCAQIDGAREPVHPTVVEGGGADASLRRVLFAYHRGDQVQQETMLTADWTALTISIPPAIGSPVLGQVGPYAGAVAVSVVIALGTAWRRLRGSG